MEHKLIQGGEHLLPFARSRIKALRATGLAYASQKFEVDGVSIEVRVVGEHDYISLSGGGSIHVDHGIVNIPNSNFNTVNPTFLPGRWVEFPVNQYNSAFKPVPDKLVRKNPGPGSEGQFAGTINAQGGALKGTLQLSTITRLRSFDMEYMEGEPTEESKNAMVLKMLAVKMCPASIFTGRARLYVQALYGAPIIDSKGRATKPFWSYSPGAPPYLNIQPASYADSSGSPVKPEAIKFGTGGGVILDEDRNHWILWESADGFFIAPLKSSTSGEKMRQSLRKIRDPQDALRLETYILSTSRPMVERKQWLPAPVSAYGEHSLGYRWHWGFNLASAVAVMRKTEPQPADLDTVPGQPEEVCISTKAQFSLFKTGSGSSASWAGRLSVDGAKKWAVNRIAWAIAGPDWSGGLEKATPKYQRLIDCDAVVYAFYAEDDLVELRVSVQLSPGDPASESSTPPSFQDIPGVQFGTTVGDLGGVYEQKYATPKYATAMFTCGSVEFRGLKFGWTQGGRKEQSSSKVWDGLGTVDFASNTTGDVYLNVGYPNPDGTYAKDFFAGYPAVFPPGVTDWFGIPYVIETRGPNLRRSSFTFTSNDFGMSAANEVSIVVPAYDSQAVFLQCDAKEGRDNDAGTVEHRSGVFSRTDGVRMRTDIYQPPEPPRIDYTVEERTWYFGGPRLGDSLISSDTSDQSTEIIPIYPDVKKVVRTDGVYDVSLIPNKFELHNNDFETIPYDFGTLSGVNKTAVSLGGLFQNQGVDGSQTEPFAFIGYA